MRGFLLVDKPSCVTSHDVVSIARRSLNIKRIGHAGTLDPFATGLLLLGVGSATRMFRYMNLNPKVYEGKIRFGVATETQDPDGRIIETKDFDLLTLEKIRNVSKEFVGDGTQLPPMYSAVKVGGKPLYKFARKGYDIERKERTIHVFDFEIISYEPPYADFVVSCSEGTYVRTLAHDLGLRLGTVAHLSQLRRIAIGPFRIEDSVPPNDINESQVIPIESVIDNFMKSFVLEDAKCIAIQNGQKIPWTTTPHRGPFALLNQQNKLVAIAHAREGHCFPECVFSEEVS